ncbi:metal ABC transporter solute-binding protein, Zn/Mn family [Brevibacterium jeotgali]|uniref:Zinc/manganese transport system substrate-binding protein n=1 Tax=Brevibacterium jeotgali TaxID=1262550 RepID=A0A2H1L1P4_9MICO|nr:zinc ABC transporter substrate-binding protein [Brevibacterium jeotgali]TWC02004.1 zinc/manganese transport system substrate-binding protein [Brevibacterium jeotgali]SMY10645.1 zinc/manganese transport system substrate-binding protein [Brevibacterium jeotgali]
MRRSPAFLALLSASGLVLAGCGSGAGAADGDSSTTVVTSTNVYASLVEAVAGDAVDVVPIIDDAAQDPHEYEATARDQLELSRADVVVMNGGGYDAFMTTMLDAIDEDPDVIDAVATSDLPGAEEAAANGHDHDHAHDHEESGEGEDAHDHEGHDHEESGEGEDAHDHEGHDHEESGEGEDAHDHEGHDHGSFNEHVWYSVPTMIALVDEIESHLAEAVPDSAETVTANADAARGELTELDDRIADLADSHGGENAAVTEPVALWLFEDLGLTNVVPDQFVSAVEMGSDVSPIVLQEATEALDDDVSVFAYNTQTSGPQADALRAEADSSGIPVVEVTETMPEGTDYVTWMTETVDAVEQAIA